MAKYINGQKYKASHRAPDGGDHALCDTDSDCAALARRLKLDDQDGGPNPNVTASDKKKIEGYKKRHRTDETGQHESIEAANKAVAKELLKKPKKGERPR